MDDIIIMLQNEILNQLGHEVAIMIRSIEEMERIISSSPYLCLIEEDINKYYVIFLEKAPAKEYVDKLNAADFSPEGFVIDDKQLYLHVPFGYGKTKLNNNFFENKLKVKATTRNWKTTNELLKLAKI